MRILITNDDGILAPGIEALYRAVSDLGDVNVVAPETTQSAMGHAITVKTPLSVRRVHVNNAFWGHAVDGRPADCVKLGILELIDSRPDFVLSGINAGANTAINVLYSGTVAGAVEGAFFGIPAMAFSLELSDELNFRAAGKIARALFQTFVASKPGRGVVWNVNIPALDDGAPKGVRACPQATIQMQDAYIKQKDAAGRELYFLDGRMPMHHDCPNTDLEAMYEGYVAVTPLRFDLTDYDQLQRILGTNWPTDLA